MAADDVAPTLPLSAEEASILRTRCPSRSYQRRVYVWPTNGERSYSIVAYFLGLIGGVLPGFESRTHSNVFPPTFNAQMVLETEDGRILTAPIGHCQFLDGP